MSEGERERERGEEEEMGAVGVSWPAQTGVRRPDVSVSLGEAGDREGPSDVA